jgi:hypothetical protein
MRTWISALMLIALPLKYIHRASLLLSALREEFTVQVNTEWRYRIVIAAFAVAVGLECQAPLLHMAAARDVDGRYADSPLKSWFENLHSSKGPCCSDADGTALSDVDWKANDDHYLVRIEGQWWDVPDEAVIREPSRAGRTMVWPVYYRERNTLLRVDIRCFIPGSMT